MAKETSIISEKVVDRFMTGITKLLEKQGEYEERKEQMKSEEYSEQKQAVKDEFNRIMAQLKKLKPGTEEYDNTARSLDKISNIIRFW